MSTINNRLIPAEGRLEPGPPDHPTTPTKHKRPEAMCPWNNCKPTTRDSSREPWRERPHGGSRGPEAVGSRTCRGPAATSTPRTLRLYFFPIIHLFLLLLFSFCQLFITLMIYVQPFCYILPENVTVTTKSLLQLT